MSKKPMQKFMDWLQYKVTPAVQKFTERPWVCLLYTSDAADEL